MRVRLLSALIGLVLMSGCGAVTSGTPLPLTHLANVFAADDAFPAETMLVLRDQTAWQNLWLQMTSNRQPAPPTPAVDFTTNMVLVAAMGTRNTGGYSIAITGALESSGGLVVDVTETSPGSNCFVTQALTSPVDIATALRRDGAVSFKVTRKVQNC